MARPVLKTALCDLLNVEYPICLAGMGGRWTPPELVAAVSNAGGLGVMGGSGIQVDELRQRIRKVRELTDKPFGVDLLLPVVTGSVERGGSDGQQESEVDAVRRQYPRHAEFVDTLMAEFGLDRVDPPPPPKEIGIALARSQVDMILEEDVQVFAAALGDPGWMVPQAHDKGVIVMGLAGSVRNAQRQIAAGVDIVVAQGTEAGGHTGRIATMPLVPQIVDAISPKPVVAAGGIANGRGIVASLALGAEGAWLGTAFLAAKECGIYPQQQQSIIRGRSEDFQISRSFTGKTARQYQGPIVQAWAASGLEPLDMPLQGVLMSTFNQAAEKAQRYDLVFNPAGQGAGMVNEARPAADIMADLVDETVSVLNEVKERVTI
ncbi:MAG: nitronate monooxygenase [Dehalococcoidia bacterium]|nr:nitronate monooxygenase [Dehalococcoidia bacterium]